MTNETVTAVEPPGGVSSPSVSAELAAVLSRAGVVLEEQEKARTPTGAKLRGYTDLEAALRGEFIVPAPGAFELPSKEFEVIWDIDGHRTKQRVRTAPDVRSGGNAGRRCSGRSSVSSSSSTRPSSSSSLQEPQPAQPFPILGKARAKAAAAAAARSAAAPALKAPTPPPAPPTIAQPVQTQEFRPSVRQCQKLNLALRASAPRCSKKLLPDHRSKDRLADSELICTGRPAIDGFVEASIQPGAYAPPRRLAPPAPLAGVRVEESINDGDYVPSEVPDGAGKQAAQDILEKCRVVEHMIQEASRDDVQVSSPTNKRASNADSQLTVVSVDAQASNADSQLTVVSVDAQAPQVPNKFDAAELEKASAQAVGPPASAGEGHKVAEAPASRKEAEKVLPKKEKKNVGPAISSYNRVLLEAQYEEEQLGNLWYTPEQVLQRQLTKAALRQNFKSLASNHQSVGADMHNLHGRLKLHSKQVRTLSEMCYAKHEIEQVDRIFDMQMKHSQLAAMGSVGAHQVRTLKTFSGFRNQMKARRGGDLGATARQMSKESSSGSSHCSLGDPDSSKEDRLRSLSRKLSQLKNVPATTSTPASAAPPQQEENVAKLNEFINNGQETIKTSMRALVHAKANMEEAFGRLMEELVEDVEMEIQKMLERKEVPPGILACLEVLGEADAMEKEAFLQAQRTAIIQQHRRRRDRLKLNLESLWSQTRKDAAQKAAECVKVQVVEELLWSNHSLMEARKRAKEEAQRALDRAMDWLWRAPVDGGVREVIDRHGKLPQGAFGNISQSQGDRPKGDTGGGDFSSGGLGGGASGTGSTMTGGRRGHATVVSLGKAAEAANKFAASVNEAREARRAAVGNVMDRPGAAEPSHLHMRQLLSELEELSVASGITAKDIENLVLGNRVGPWQKEQLHKLHGHLESVNDQLIRVQRPGKDGMPGRIDFGVLETLSSALPALQVSSETVGQELHQVVKNTVPIAKPRRELGAPLPSGDDSDSEGAEGTPAGKSAPSAAGAGTSTLGQQPRSLGGPQNMQTSPQQLQQLSPQSARQMKALEATNAERQRRVDTLKVELAKLGRVPVADFVAISPQSRRGSRSGAMVGMVGSADGPAELADGAVLTSGLDVSARQTFGDEVFAGSPANSTMLDRFVDPKSSAAAPGRNTPRGTDCQRMAPQRTIMEELRAARTEQGRMQTQKEDIDESLGYWEQLYSRARGALMRAQGVSEVEVANAQLSPVPGTPILQRRLSGGSPFTLRPATAASSATSSADAGGGGVLDPTDDAVGDWRQEAMKQEEAPEEEDPMTLMENAICEALGAKRKVFDKPGGRIMAVKRLTKMVCSMNKDLTIRRKVLYQLLPGTRQTGMGGAFGSMPGGSMGPGGHWTLKTNQDDAKAEESRLKKRLDTLSRLVDFWQKRIDATVEQQQESAQPALASQTIGAIMEVDEQEEEEDGQAVARLDLMGSTSHYSSRSQRVRKMRQLEEATRQKTLHNTTLFFMDQRHQSEQHAKHAGEGNPFMIGNFAQPSEREKRFSVLGSARFGFATPMGSFAGPMMIGNAAPWAKPQMLKGQSVIHDDQGGESTNVEPFDAPLGAAKRASVFTNKQLKGGAEHMAKNAHTVRELLSLMQYPTLTDARLAGITNWLDDKEREIIVGFFRRIFKQNMPAVQQNLKAVARGQIANKSQLRRACASNSSTEKVCGVAALVANRLVHLEKTRQQVVQETRKARRQLAFGEP